MRSSNQPVRRRPEDGGSTGHPVERIRGTTAIDSKHHYLLSESTEWKTGLLKYEKKKRKSREST